jgi:AcrR family transcriptional regulator
MLHERRFDAEAELAGDVPPAGVAIASAPRADPRKRLLDAMIETVALRGYDHSTVNRVLWSAEVQEAVFSEHFRDKRDCFMQAVEDLLGRVERSALQRFQQDAPWPRRMREALGSLLDALARDPRGARVVLVEMLGAGPSACERQRAALTLFTSLVDEGRLSCSNAERLPPQTSEAIVGGIASIVHRRVLLGDTAELPRLHADLTYFALLPYLDHEQALTAARSCEPQSADLDGR